MYSEYLRIAFFVILLVCFYVFLFLNLLCGVVTSRDEASTQLQSKRLKTVPSGQLMTTSCPVAGAMYLVTSSATGRRLHAPCVTSANVKDNADDDRK